MNEQLTNPILIYHDVCADGFSAAWAFWSKYKDEFEYFPGKHGTSELPNVQGRDVFLADFSYKRPIIEKWLNEAKSITILDHHKTAIDALQDLLDNGKIGGVLDNSRSGAMIAWNWVYPGIEPPALLKHVQDRDLWKFELKWTNEVQNNLFSYEYDFETWDNLMNQDLEQLIPGGIAITRKHKKDVSELIESLTHKAYIAGYIVPCCNIPYIYSSEAGNILSKDHPFAFCYTYTENGITLSLRSQANGVDVSKIAEIFGGGGHYSAAGCKLSHHQVYWNNNIMYIEK